MNELNLLFCLLLASFCLSCQKDSSTAFVKLEYENIDLDCITKASGGGTFSLRIDTQVEYDSIYYLSFTKPLEDWYSSNYSALIQGVIRNYPKAHPSEYDSILINDYIYNFAPYLFIKDCNHPTIDFDTYTLLGQGTGVGGCSSPSVESEICADEEQKLLVFTTKIETYGLCEIGFSIQNWILVDKVDPQFKVEFKVEESNM